jgi:alpha-1,3-rhamnosyl/mannosyltransferase
MMSLREREAPSEPLRDVNSRGGSSSRVETTGQRRPGAPDNSPAAASGALRVALLYDMDACYDPTGVTRHALAQLDRLARRPEIALTVLTGRMTHPDGLAFWESVDGPAKRELPLRTRDLLRWWRIKPWPPIEWWTGPIDWVYSPAEFFVPSRQARKAVTSHDVLQLLRYDPPRKRELMARVFEHADLVLSVSRFNTERLLEAFPCCRDRVAYVPNAADDLFFDPAPPHERARCREDLGLPPGMPYLLSVANFQPRKNLVRLVNAVSRLPEVSQGELALVILGTGAEDEARPIREAAVAAGRRALIRLPGYRQGRALRAAYAEATALVFPSLCESFGIPAVEAMAQGTSVALADSTALPEIGGEAGWYFDPTSEDTIANAIRRLLDDSGERSRRAMLGRAIADHYRWQHANDRLVEALRSVPCRSGFPA